MQLATDGRCDPLYLMVSTFTATLYVLCCNGTETAVTYEGNFRKFSLFILQYEYLLHNFSLC